MELKVIAKIYTDFKEKFGIPRQRGIARETVGKIVFEREYRRPEALRGLSGFSHLPPIALRCHFLLIELDFVYCVGLDFGW